MNQKVLSVCKKTISYILVAALASAGTWLAAEHIPNSKLERLSNAIENRFIGQQDTAAMEDAAAEAMIAALGDRWSYYISAEEYAAHRQRQSNEYVGIGITIQLHPEGLGFAVVAVTAEGPAEEAGILPGDTVTHADGTSLAGMDLDGMKELILGKANTQVVLTVLRDGQTRDIAVTRRTIHSRAAQGRMLTDTVGYVAISNFHGDSGQETLEEIEKLTQQGAQSLIFDVRGNPGGYVDEMVQVLDYLLPEGALFRSVDYRGREDVEESGPECLDLPMAVLINGSTYSAAEFFAAALSEYDWAVTVGEPTCGKGYYQVTIELGDGSAVQLSTGAYTTPNGVNLSEIGGLQPDVEVAPDAAAESWQQDPQILAALEALAE